MPTKKKASQRRTHVATSAITRANRQCHQRKSAVQSQVQNTDRKPSYAQLEEQIAVLEEKIALLQGEGQVQSSESRVQSKFREQSSE